MKKLTANEILRLVAENNFSPFSKTDWDAWSGAVGENPLISSPNDPPCVIVIDDNGIALLFEDSQEDVTGHLVLDD